MSMMLPNWSELPEELLSIVSEKLDFYEDFLRFSVVCHPWRSAATLNNRRDFLKCFPWLMLPADEEDEEDDQRCFFIPSKNKVYQFSLPEARGCHCWGSPYGLLVTFGLDQQFHLLNPVSRIRFPLPPRSTFQDSNFTDEWPSDNRAFCVRKAVLSKDTKDGINQFVVYLIIGQVDKLAFARPGDKTWTVVENSYHHKDVISFNAQIYTVRCEEIMLCDNNTSGSHPTLTHFANLPDGVPEYDQFYLVELDRELHLVVRSFDRTQDENAPIEFPHFFETVCFEVYKLDLSTRKWDELQTLGDYALFIGSNTSFALKASDYPECKPGCIYFTDNCVQAYRRLIGGDMGIVNLETDTFEHLYEGDDILSRFSPPLWITPNPF